MKKRILALLLALVMLVGLLPTVALATDGETTPTETPMSGSLGDTATWTYNADTKTLTISGTGATKDYGMGFDYAPPYADSAVYPIEHFVVEEGITRLGAYVLYSFDRNAGSEGYVNKTVTDIKLPDSLTEIGGEAICRHAALKSITFPKGMTSFNTSWKTFGNCDALEEIKFEGAVTELGQVYRYCKGLKSITIPDTVTSIVDWAFQGCSQITEVTFPDSVTSIGGSIFSECPALTKVTLPSKLESLGNGALQLCKGLTELTLPDTLTTIGAYAFSSCTGIQELVIPASVTAIGNSAFSRWTADQKITFPWKVTEAPKKIALGERWNSGCNAALAYVPMAAEYCDGLTVTLKDGEKSYAGTMDLSTLILTFQEDVDIMRAPTFTAPEMIITGNDGAAWTGGTATLAGDLTFTEESTGLYTTEATLTLAPAEGTAGDTIPLNIRFVVHEKEYTFQGSGTEEDPYLVDSALALYQMSQKVGEDEQYDGKHWKQTANIDMSVLDKMDPIGGSDGFIGHYDGGNFTIDNLHIESRLTYVGLFTIIKTNSLVENVVLGENSVISGTVKGGYLGGIVGEVGSSSVVKNCVNYATILGKHAYDWSKSGKTGGITGSLGGRAIGCKNYGRVTETIAHTHNVAGIAGSNGKSSFIIGCENHGEVTSPSQRNGGAGSQAGGITTTLYGNIVGCWNDGPITGGEYIGGIISKGDWMGTYVESCYNLGSVTSNDPNGKVYIGGLAGGGTWADWYNSYSVGTVTVHPDTREGYARSGLLFGHFRGTGAGNYFLGNDIKEGYGSKNNGMPEPTKAVLMPVDESWLKSSAALNALNSYTEPQSLYYTTWVQGENGYPTIAKVEKIPSHFTKISSFTVTLDGKTYPATISGTDISIILPSGTTTITPNITISNKATVSPASGESVDISSGTASFVVTAENGTNKTTYTLHANVASSASGLAALRMTIGYGDPFFNAEDFSQQTHTYTLNVPDATVAQSWGQKVRVYAILANPNDTLTAQVNDTDPVALKGATSLDDESGRVPVWLHDSETQPMHLGENDFKLIVTPASGEPTVYTIKVNVQPSLASLSFTAGEETLKMDKNFNSGVTDYTLEIPGGVTEINIAAASKMGDELAPVTLPEGTTDGKLDITNLTSFTIKVGKAPTETTYTITLNKRETYFAQIISDPAGAAVTVLNTDANETILPDEDGSYRLYAGSTYTVKATKLGYLTATAKITSAEDLTDGKFTIKLTAIASPLPSYNGEWMSFRGNDANMGVTSAETPTSAAQTELRWAVQLGHGWDASVTPPLIINGDLYVQAGTEVMKIDKATGKIKASATIPDSSRYTMNPVAYGDGMIFASMEVPVGATSGYIVALNADTLEQLWVSEKLAGQMISPITYHNGYIYTGTWNNESSEGTYFALSVTDEDPFRTDEVKSPIWTVTHKGGFYWAGSYATDKYVVFGSDDGTYEGDTGTATLYSVDPLTGRTISKIGGIQGDVRTSIAYDDGHVYFATKGGYFYKAALSDTGMLSDLQSFNMGYMATGTPIVYNGIGFVSCSGKGTSQFDAGFVIAVDIATMTELDRVASYGYVQASMLLTTAYESTGTLYLYAPNNYTPGNVQVVAYDKATKKLAIEDLYVPTGNTAQYCLCPIVCDADGTLYFKNDSGYMFAVARATGTSGWKVTFDANGGRNIGASAAYTDVQTGKLTAMASARRDGYTMLGWFTEKDGGERVTLDTVYTKDTKIYAHWEKEEDPARKDSVTVYFSLSNDGEYLKSDITGQMLAQLPVTLNYFDLKDYGLQDFYRTGSDGKAIVHPTLLHLFIKMLEDQYLGTDLVVGQSARSDLQYGRNDSDEIYKALRVSGTATSLYMTNFWGHDENLLYYVNHQYPLMYEGWGSTADWILLEDGDTVEVAMFTDWSFTQNKEAGFPYFRQGKTIVDSLTLTANASTTLTVARAKADASGERGEKLNPNTTIYYTTSPDQASGDVTTWTKLGTTDADGKISISFREPGTYYIAVPGTSVRAPGICKVTVLADTAVADAVAKINAIGDVDENSGDAIKAARKAFDALTPEQKAQIPQATQDKLTQAERDYQAILDQKAADEAVRKINAIPGEITKASGDAIKAARKAYDALNEAAKALVPADAVKKLTDAEVKYADLMKPTRPVTPSTPSTPSKPTQKPDTGASLPFADVAGSSWFYDGVKFAYEKGLMNGTGANMFSPNATTTRGMIVTVLARVEGVNTNGALWYAAGQKWAMDNGISDGTNMTGDITREQLAAILYRYAKQKGYDVTKSAALTGFSDAGTVSSYATEAMQWAVANGLIQGSGNQLSPKATASRAQVATILMRFMELYTK